MPILFFDVDGPMVPGRGLFLPKNIAPRYGWEFDPCAVGMLNFLNWAVPNLQVVISSHRVGMRSPFDGSYTDTKESWERVFQENGLKLQIHKDWCTVKGKAKLEDRVNKLEEIRGWRGRNKAHSDDRFVVIEDEAIYARDITDEERDVYHICAEDYLDGITWRDLKRIANFLGVDNLSEKIREYQMMHSAFRKSPTIVTKKIHRIEPSAI